jgi:hypothetical protein
MLVVDCTQSTTSSTHPFTMGTLDCQARTVAASDEAFWKLESLLKVERETLPDVNRINMRGAGMPVYDKDFEYNLNVFIAPAFWGKTVKIVQRLR